jgi:hypothetical protein
MWKEQKKLAFTYTSIQNIKFKIYVTYTHEAELNNNFTNLIFVEHFIKIHLYLLVITFSLILST